MSDQEKEDTAGFDPEELKAINDQMIQSQLITPDRLYVDLAIMRDFGIGAIMSHAFEKGEQEARRVYSHVFGNMKAYQRRYFFDPLHYFPECGMTRSQLTERLLDPKYSDHIFRAAPVTEFLALLGTHIAVNVNHSAVKGKTDKPITITLNTYPLTLSEETKKLIAVYLATTFGVEVRIWREDLSEISLKKIFAFDEYYLYYIKEFSHNQAIHKSLSDGEFSEKRIFGIPVCGYEVDKSRSDKSLAQELLLVESRLNVLTLGYKHIPIEKCSPPSKGRNPLKDMEKRQENTPSREDFHTAT